MRRILTKDQFEIAKLASGCFGVSTSTIRVWHLKHGCPLSSLLHFSMWYGEHAAIKDNLKDETAKRTKERLRAISRQRKGNADYLKKAAAQNKTRYYKNIEATRKMERERKREYRKDPTIKLAKSLRARLYSLVRFGSATKHGSALRLCGCSVPELKRHLEAQFKRGMNWGNYGKAWHIDHIIPCSKFNLHNPEEQARCFNYLNLQPLVAAENLSKSDKILQPTQIPLATI